MGLIDESERALEKAIHDSGEILAQATTVFAPERTTLILNRTKLVVEKKSPLGARQVTSVPIEDVVNVSATAGPFFGTVTFITKLAGPSKPHNVGLFWRKDTIKLKRTIQGYIIARQQKIDLSVVPIAELRAKVYELGTDDHSIKWAIATFPNLSLQKSIILVWAVQKISKIRWGHSGVFHTIGAGPPRQGIVQDSGIQMTRAY